MDKKTIIRKKMKRNMEKIKRLMKGKQKTKLKKCKEKSMQNEVHEKNSSHKLKCHRWLQCNIKPKKLEVQKPMLETRAWRANRGLPVESDKCQI